MNKFTYIHKDLCANVTMMILHVIYVWSPTSEAQEVPGIRLNREMTEKHTSKFCYTSQILSDYQRSETKVYKKGKTISKSNTTSEPMVSYTVCAFDFQMCIWEEFSKFILHIIVIPGKNSHLRTVLLPLLQQWWYVVSDLKLGAGRMKQWSKSESEWVWNLLNVMKPTAKKILKHVPKVNNPKL